MSNVLNYRTVRDPFRPTNAFQRIHRFDGIYTGGTSAAEQAEYFSGLYDRASKFRGSEDAPYAFRDDSWNAVSDDEELLRQISLNQYYYQRYAQLSRGNNYVNPHDYIYLPTIVPYITRWRLEVVEVQLTNPCRIVVRRRPEIYDSYLEHDGLGGSISSRYFLNPTNTHGFGNATTNYTQDGRGISCLFARLPTNISGQYGAVMNDLNTGGAGRFGDERYWYLKVITENILEVYFDHTLNSPLNASGWDRIDLSSSTFGIPICYAQNPTNTNRYYGQMVHLDAFNFGKQQWINDSGAYENPQIEFFHSIAGDWSSSTYPFRVEVAGVVTNKMSTANANAGQYQSRSFSIDNLTDAQRQYVPSITTTIDSNGVLNSATFDPQFSGLFTQYGGEYAASNADTVKTNGVSFADAHIIKFTASSSDKVAAGLTGISGTADKPIIQTESTTTRPDAVQNIVDGEGGRGGYFINTENDFEWTEPLTHRVTISNIMHSRTSAGRQSPNIGRLNGEPLALRKVGPKRFEVLRLVNGVASRIGISADETLSGGVLLLYDVNSLDNNELSYTMGGGVTQNNSLPGNNQIWPDVIAPNNVQSEYLQGSYSNVSLGGIKYTSSIGSRGYKIRFTYNNLSEEHYHVFDSFIKSMKGQYAQFRLPTSYNGWKLFSTNQANIDIWNNRIIYGLKHHRLGENVLYIGGFDPLTKVINAEDHITWNNETRDYTRNIITEASQDVTTNKFGEAIIRLSQPLQEDIPASSRFALFNKEFVIASLDNDSFVVNHAAHGLRSFKVGFDVVL